MITVKIDILNELRKAGYSVYQLRKEKIFGGRTIDDFRNNKIAKLEQLDKLCSLLNLEVDEIIEYRKEDDNMRITNNVDREVEFRTLEDLKGYYTNIDNDDEDVWLDPNDKQDYEKWIADLQNANSVQEFVETFNSQTDRFDNGSNLIIEE